MNKVKTLSIITLVFSGLSVLALIFSHLALTDIHHGAEDLSLEWTVLRIAAVIFLACIISTIVTLRQVLKSISRNKED